MRGRPMPSIVIDPANLEFIETVVGEHLLPWQIDMLSALADHARKHSGDDA